MALEKNANAVYLTIGDGKITKRVKEPTADSTERKKKDGGIVHEEIFDSVSGMVTDIKVQAHPQYGKFWNVSITDGEERYILQMNYSGGYSSAFLKMLPNVDFTKRLRFSPSLKIEGGKKKVTLYLSQDGNPLKWAYTKDAPNGLPEMRQIKVKGQLQWDDSEMMEFLEQMMNREILPKIAAAQGIKPLIDETEEDETEKLPF